MELADVAWFKVLTDIFSDDKIKIIESLPEGDALLVMWFKVMAQAGKTNDGGYIYLKKNIPYSNAMLATLFNKSQQLVESAMRTFINFGMIDVEDDGYIFVTNREKHQFVEKLDKIRDDTRIRVANYREKKKLELQQGNVTSNANVTHGNDTEEELELDLDLDLELDLEEKKKKKDIKSKDIILAQFEEFYLFYPKKVGKKDALRHFERLNKDKAFSFDEFVTGTKNYVDHCNKDNRFLKDASAFVNQETYKDFIDVSTIPANTKPSGNASFSKAERNKELIRQAKEREAKKKNERSEYIDIAREDNGSIPEL
jgi:predicted phage replisome organizer